MKIEYEDRDILVVCKEAGLAVQTARASRKDLVSVLKNYLSESNGNRLLKEGQTEKGINGAGRNRPAVLPYLGIIHRLDQPVEGLLVFAKTPESAARLSEQAAGKSGMEKIYQAAVCLDHVSYPLAVEALKKEVSLENYLGRDRMKNMAYIAAPSEQGAKNARLSFRTLWIRDSKALLEIRLFTGRHHQIRVQMAHASMPLLGDRKYGSGEEGFPLCLCAARLSILHPGTGKKMEFSVDPSWLPLI